MTDRARRAKVRLTLLVAINAVFGVMLATWPFVAFGSFFYDTAPSDLIYLLSIITTMLYPVMYTFAVVFSVRAYRDGDDAFEIVKFALIPAMSAHPWHTLRLGKEFFGF